MTRTCIRCGQPYRRPSHYVRFCIPCADDFDHPTVAQLEHQRALGAWQRAQAQLHLARFAGLFLPSETVP